MEYTFQTQKSLLKNWNYVKFTQIKITSNKNMFSYIRGQRNTKYHERNLKSFLERTISFSFV